MIIGANGHRSLSDYKRALNPKGTYVCTGGTMAQIFESMLQGPLMSKKGGKQIVSFVRSLMTTNNGSTQKETEQIIMGPTTVKYHEIQGNRPQQQKITHTGP